LTQITNDRATLFHNVNDVIPAVSHKMLAYHLQMLAYHLQYCH